MSARSPAGPGCPTGGPRRSSPPPPARSTRRAVAGRWASCARRAARPAPQPADLGLAGGLPGPRVRGNADVDRARGAPVLAVVAGQESLVDQVAAQRGVVAVELGQE